jgi:hypothetical protein
MKLDLAERALAKLCARAKQLNDDVHALHSVARVLPLTIQTQLVCVEEELDLLRHRLHEETLRRAIGGPITQGKLKKPLTKERPRA